MRIYLDTNVYIVGLTYPDSPSSMVLRKIVEKDLHVTQSDYLYDEVLNYFKRSQGKDVAARVREYLLTIPNNEIVDKYTWSIYIEKYSNMIADIDDIPHICSYFADECDHFITLNRRLTKMRIGKIVDFKSPSEFLSFLESDETQDIAR